MSNVSPLDRANHFIMVFFQPLILKSTTKDHEDIWCQAKKHALNCVNEILKSENTGYWREVKSIIEK